MKELSVYYCNECGHYAYYQLPSNAVCPRCNKAMERASVSYSDFINLDCSQRDELITNLILNNCQSVVKRITYPHKTYNRRELIASLLQEINHLEQENQRLEDTVSWMHQTIWKLLKKTKEPQSCDTDQK